MKKILSGVQTTGILTLGNYLGSIRNWVRLQDNNQAILFLADLHSITVPRSAEDLRNSTYYVIAAYLACGLDPERSIIFAQSSVPEHTELGWIFSCLTPLGWLNRMTQFKEKAGKDKENASLGLYGYPVLQAADILLYKADIVPVGEDQKQHVELTRDIAGAFNRHVGQEYFTLPEPLIQGVATRIMSLRDGTKKMSKSDPSDYSRINLTDDADTIKLKFQKAKTDADPSISYDEETRPEIANLINIYSAFTDLSSEEIVEKFDGKGFANFKQQVADIVISEIEPIGNKIKDYLENKDYLEQVLRDGAIRARAIASRNLKEIYDLFGFIR